MSGGFPPRARLAHVLRALATTLPAELGDLLAMPRLAPGAAALARLADPAHAERAIAALTTEEATFLADALLARAALVAPARLEPAAAIALPAEGHVWVGTRPRHVALSLATLGLATEPRWETAWEGATAGDPAHTAATLTVRPPGRESRESPFEHVVRARVRGRSATDGARCALVAEARVRVHVLQAAFSEDGRTLTITDHTGAPGAGLRVTRGAYETTTTSAGMAVLPRSDDPITVDEIPIDAPAPPG